MTYDWCKLQTLWLLCRCAGVSFSLNYEEASEEWYCTIDSAAPAERFAGRSTSYDFAIKHAVDWVRKISPSCSDELPEVK